MRNAPAYATLSSPEFEANADRAVERMLARQAAFDTEWFPDGFKRWSCDQSEGIIRFVKADGTGIQAAVQILGSYAPDSQTWEWAWNNPHINEELARDARVARAHGEARGYALLTTGIVRVTLEEARRLIGMAAMLVDAPAVHWGDMGPYLIAMTYWDARTIARKDVRTPATSATDDEARENRENDDTNADDDHSDGGGLLTALGAWLLTSILTLIFGKYARHPIVLKRGAPAPMGGHYFPLTADHESRIAPYLLDDMAEIEQVLVGRGASPPLRVASADAEEINMFYSLIELPEEEAIGFVLVNASQYSGVTRTTTFETRFADGVILYTTNTKVTGRTPNRRVAHGITFPAVTDVARLHDIHRFRVKERIATIPTVSTTRGADPFAYMDAEARKIQAFWIERGYYRLTANGTMARTWRGAVLAAWRGLFPWKQLTDMGNARKADAVLRRMGR